MSAGVRSTKLHEHRSPQDQIETQIKQAIHFARSEDQMIRQHLELASKSLLPHA